MKEILSSKGLCVLCQVLAAIFLGNAWLMMAEVLRSTVGFWGIGILLIMLCAVCLVRTLRTPYKEEWANRTNLLLHVFAFVLCLVSAVLYGKEYGILPDMKGIVRMFRYDFDDGVVNAMASFGTLTSLMGAVASAIVAAICVSVRRKDM